MLSIVKMKPAVDIHQLINSLGKIEDVTEDEVFDVFQGMTYTGCNGSYVEIDGDCLVEYLCDSLDITDHLNDTDKELLRIMKPITPDEKVRFKLFQMIYNRELPTEFIVLVWW